jgi:phenylacetate-CoA ligase
MMRALDRVSWTAYLAWHVRGEGRLPFAPIEAIERVQRRRLRRMVAHAHANVPHYRDAMDGAGLRPEDLRTADDLARLPEISGHDLAEMPERFGSPRHAAAPGVTIHSSGTTGRPKTVRHDAAALFLSLAHGERQRIVLSRFVGRRRGYREMNAIRAGAVGVQLRQFYEAHSWVPARVDLARSLLPPLDPFEVSAARLRAFAPDVLRGYGSHLGALFRWAVERGVSVFRPRAIVYGADAMPEADRALIEAELGIPVLSTYQTVEALRIGFQCEERRGFHLSLDQVAVRVVDDAGRAVGPGGTGHIVLSNLTNRATVLLNYRLGDLVTLGRSACPCGRTLPTIEGIAGRSDDLILRPDGQPVHALAVLEPLRAVPGIAQLQVIQDDLRRFRLRAVATGSAPGPASAEALGRALQAAIGFEAAVAVEWVPAIPPDAHGKVRAVISHAARR